MAGLAIYVEDDEMYPTKDHESDAGFDLRCKHDQIKLPQQRAFFMSTGTHFIIPGGVVGIIKPRSGLAMLMIDVLAGVIDSGYTGEVKVGLINHGTGPVIFNKGDRIAQILFLNLSNIRPVYQVDRTTFDILKDHKDRQDKGFGSTGIT